MANEHANSQFSESDQISNGGRDRSGQSIPVQTPEAGHRRR